MQGRRNKRAAESQTGRFDFPVGSRIFYASERIAVPIPYNLKGMEMVGHLLDDLLHLTLPGEPLPMQREVVLMERHNSSGHGYDPLLGLLAIGATLALNAERFLLPEHMLRCQGAKFRDAQAGVEQGPDNEFFFRHLTCVTEGICFFCP